MSLEHLIRKQPFPDGHGTVRVAWSYSRSWRHPSDVRAGGICLTVPRRTSTIYEALPEWVPYDRPDQGENFHGVDRTCDWERMAGFRVAWEGSLADTVKTAMKWTNWLLGAHPPGVVVVPEGCSGGGAIRTPFGVAEVLRTSHVDRGYLVTPDGWTNYDGTWICHEPGGQAVFEIPKGEIQ